MGFGCRAIAYRIYFGLIVLLLAGCSDDHVTMGDVESVRVPLNFNISAGRVSQSRAVQDNVEGGGIAAEGVREVHVDRVRLNVYRRPTDGTYIDDTEGYALCPHNSNIVLECKKFVEFPHYRASGSIEILRGQTYRVTAVAYSDEQGEEELFTMDGRTYSEHKLRLVEEKAYKCPELFFGTLLWGTADQFAYEAMENGLKPLEGWLYRGVAGIEVNLTGVPDNVARVELLTKSLHTCVEMKNYDEFNSPSDAKQHSDGFVLLAATPAGGEVTLKGVNLLPTTTAMELRVTYADDSSAYYRLRLKLITTTKPGGEKEDFTDTEAKEEIAFERNHYYKISGRFDDLNNMEYALTVIVNPNWDGDVNLGLERE